MSLLDKEHNKFLEEFYIKINDTKTDEKNIISMIKEKLSHMTINEKFEVSSISNEEKNEMLFKILDNFKTNGNIVFETLKRIKLNFRELDIKLKKKKNFVFYTNFETIFYLFKEDEKSEKELLHYYEEKKSMLLTLIDVCIYFFEGKEYSLKNTPFNQPFILKLFNCIKKFFDLKINFKDDRMTYLFIKFYSFISEGRSVDISYFLKIEINHFLKAIDSFTKYYFLVKLWINLIYNMIDSFNWTYGDLVEEDFFRNKIFYFVFKIQANFPKDFDILKTCFKCISSIRFEKIKYDKIFDEKDTNIDFLKFNEKGNYFDFLFSSVKMYMFSTSEEFELFFSVIKKLSLLKIFIEKRKNYQEVICKFIKNSYNWYNKYPEDFGEQMKLINFIELETKMKPSGNRFALINMIFSDSPFYLKEIFRILPDCLKYL